MSINTEDRNIATSVFTWIMNNLLMNNSLTNANGEKDTTISTSKTRNDSCKNFWWVDLVTLELDWIITDKC